MATDSPNKIFIIIITQVPLLAKLFHLRLLRLWPPILVRLGSRGSSARMFEYIVYILVARVASAATARKCGMPLSQARSRLRAEGG